MQTPARTAKGAGVTGGGVGQHQKAVRLQQFAEVRRHTKNADENHELDTFAARDRDLRPRLVKKDGERATTRATTQSKSPDVSLEKKRDVRSESDIELVARMKTEPSVSAELFRRYSGYVAALARRRGAHDVDAVVSEAFLWLLVGRWRVNPKHVAADGTIKAFIVVLTRYATWRCSWVERHYESIENPDVTRRLSAQTPTPEQQLLQAERRDGIKRAFRGLPVYLKKVARLRYFDEQSSPEIAAAVGVSPTSVSGYLHLIRQHLRRPLRKFYRLPEPSGRARGGHVRFDRPGRYGTSKVNLQG